MSGAERPVGLVDQEGDEIQIGVVGDRHLVCQVQPLTGATHDKAVALAKRYRISIDNATSAASALEAGCNILYSEEFQNGQKLDGLTILNPFH